jgi:voltage-gated potassium channel Kch
MATRPSVATRDPGERVADADGHLVVTGDARRDAVLQETAVERARW